MDGCNQSLCVVFFAERKSDWKTRIIGTTAKQSHQSITSQPELTNCWHFLQIKRDKSKRNATAYYVSVHAPASMFIVGKQFHLLLLYFAGCLLTRAKMDRTK